MTQPIAAPMIPLPAFEPHPLLRGAHAQTLAGTYLPGPRFVHRSVHRVVTLADGDCTVLHDQCPPNWRPGQRTALLIHGLGGCHRSPYMVRLAGKLSDRGVRTFRMDLRNCGAALGMARSPYHAGRSDDARSALEQIGCICPSSPTTLVGFSLGGNLVLKLLGEASGGVPANLNGAIAVNPPIDLRASVDAIAKPVVCWYDRHFVRILYRQVKHCRLKRPELPDYPAKAPPRRLVEFDECYTAPVCGFGTAADYYAASSSAQFLPSITLPTLILASRDDPLVPVNSFEKLELPDSVRLHVSPSGGHLGYVARAGADPDRRWMDWRIIDWIEALGNSNGRPAVPIDRPAANAAG